MTQRTTTCLGVMAAFACAAVSGCGGITVAGIASDFVPGSRARLAADALSAETADARREAVITMSLERWWGLKPAAVRAYALIARTKNEEPTVRCVTLRALGRAGPEAIPHADDILVALGDRGSHHVRWDAAIALDGVWTGGDEPYLAKIISAIIAKPKDPEPEKVAAALAGEWSDKVVPRLMARLKWDRERRKGEQSLDVRVACARALRNCRRTEVVVALAAAMENDDDYAVRREAHESLVELVGHDRGWAESDWKKDMAKLPPSASPGGGKQWWDPLGLFVGSGQGSRPDDS